MPEENNQEISEGVLDQSNEAIHRTESNDGLNQSKQAIPPGEWPVSEGRYRVGNADSPVAVCTMASVEMDIPMDRIAIMGKCVTENLGVEKIVRNTVSNTNIRFILLCGKDSQGHFVGQAIQSLKENGVDGEKRIIGAKGAMPVLKNLSSGEIERFRKQIEVIDMTGETDPARILARVIELNERNPGPFGGPDVGGDIMDNGADEIRAEAHSVHEWVRDPVGFFTVCPDSDRKEIVVEHHDNDGKIKTKILGSSAEDLYHHIIRLGLVSRQDHAAYLGRELAKAEAAMRHSLDYEQDADLKISKGNNEQRGPAPPERKPPETVFHEGREFPRAVRPKPLAVVQAPPAPVRRRNGRVLTYLKGLKEIELVDVTEPEHEFRALLRERGLSRIF